MTTTTTTVSPPHLWTRRKDPTDSTLRWVLAHGTESKSLPLAFVSQLTATPHYPAGRVIFQHVRNADARVASRGYEISEEDMAVVQQVSVLSFPQKFQWFCQQMRKPLTEDHVTMHIDRENALVESMPALLRLKREHMYLPLKITFKNEGEAPVSEWLVLVAEKLFDETNGLFQHPHGDIESWTINANSLAATGDHLLYFRGAGRLLGRALLEGVATKTHLAMPLLKHLLGQPITLEDMKAFDPETYETLVRIQDEKEEMDVSALCLDFSAVMTRIGGGGEEMAQVVALKVNGREIPVTDDNKSEYVALRMQYTMLDAFAEQLQHLMAGLFEVVPQEILLPFTPEELDRVLFDPTAVDEETDVQTSDEGQVVVPKTLSFLPKRS